MDILELMKYRRSIRRYTDRQVSEEDLLKILEAGAYAPNAAAVSWLAKTERSMKR